MKTFDWILLGVFFIVLSGVVGYLVYFEASRQCDRFMELSGNPRRYWQKRRREAVKKPLK